MQKLNKQQKDLTFEKWVNNRLQSTNVEIDEDALWASINMELYATDETVSQ